MLTITKFRTRMIHLIMMEKKKLLKMHQAKMFHSFLLSKHMIIQNHPIPILLLGFHLTIQIQPRRNIMIIISTIMVMIIKPILMIPRPMHHHIMIVIMLGTIKTITRSIHICIRIPMCLLKYGNHRKVWKKQQYQY